MSEAAVVLPGAASAPEPPDGPLPRLPERVHLHMPVDVRCVSLAVLALLAGIFTLRWAGAVFIPVMLGLMLSYALNPLVNRLERLHLPRAPAAAVILLVLVGGLGWTGYALSDDAAVLLESLPEAAKKVRQAVRTQRTHSDTAVDKVQKAATQLEEAAEEGGASLSAAARGITRVQIAREQFNIKDYLWSGTLGLFAAIGQAAVVLFIAFFLLASGDSFRRKIVKVAGPTLAQRRITVQALDQITEQIQRYLLVQAGISVLVGVATGLAFWAVGVEHAAVWGVAACVLNSIPYVGALAIMAGAALVGFLQFGNIQMALLVGGTSLLLHVVTGQLLMPWLMSRATCLNAVAAFVGILAFGWLWGIWGLLLGVPILMMVKAVCDRVDGFGPVGELLGS